MEFTLSFHIDSLYDNDIDGGHVMDIKLIEDAKQTLQGIITKTPLVKADKIHPNLWIKAENLQSTGAFKLRGGYYRLSKLSNEDKKKGVIAASAGNHAQGVAYACQQMGIQGTIVMPKTAPLSKIEATRNYGVHVELQGDTFNDAYEYAKNLQEITGAVFIEPFNDEYVMAGQGTIGLEILDKLEDVDIVLVPVGGGGLISGIACAIKEKKPTCKVYGVQAALAPSMYESLKQDKPVTLSSVATMADGIAVKTPGDLTFGMCKKYVDGILLVSEEEIAASILTLLERMKMVAEGAGAVAVAAAMFHKIDMDNKKCVAVLSGGNIDVNFLSKIIDLGLIKTGRKAVLQMNVIDKPGNLSKIIDLISEAGANIVSIDHSRITEEVLSSRCRVAFVLETLSNTHIDEIIRVLHENGYEPQLEHHA